MSDQSDASSDQPRLKKLHEFVMLAPDKQSYLQRDDTDPSRPKNFDTGKMIFLDADHIHQLDELMKTCSKKNVKDIDIKKCNHPECENKAIFGAPGKPNNPTACHQHKHENHKHIRCDVATCQERCFMVVDGKHLCLGHVFLNGKPSTAPTNPDIMHYRCPLCRKQSKYGIETKQTMCSPLATIVTTILGIETKNVFNTHCGQLVSGNPCGKQSYYKHRYTNEWYCKSCAKSSGKEIWNNLIYTGPQACVMCHKRQGTKKDTVSENYVCGQCIDAYTEKHKDARLAHANHPCRYGDGCLNRSLYGTKKGRAVACKDHKTAEMIDVVHPRCPTCEAIIGYNYATQVRQRHTQCRTCRQTNDTSVVPRFKEFVVLKNFMTTNRKSYPHATFIENMAAPSDADPTKRYRPDLVVSLDNRHNVVIEVDEHEHDGRNQCEENDRVICISQPRTETNAMTSIIRVNPDFTRLPIFHRVPTKREAIAYYETNDTTLIDDIDAWISGTKDVEILDECIDTSHLNTFINVMIREFKWARQRETSVLTYIGYDDASVHLPDNGALIESRDDPLPVKRYSLHHVIAKNNLVI